MFVKLFLIAQYAEQSHLDYELDGVHLLLNHSCKKSLGFAP